MSIPPCWRAGRTILSARPWPTSTSVVDIIGEGGFGAVYRAIQVPVQRSWWWP
ncbi:MAG: hypothetical protein R3F43_17700 [bacterium]